MNSELQEVEVKLHTPDLEAVTRRLEAADAILLKPRVFERNIRYDSADGALMAAGIVLRLRRDETAKLTYKADASVERGIVSRFEAEVEVSDFETMDVILKRLGYEVALVYEKYRTTYTLDGAEIVLDELPFGNFTEIEGDAATIERVVVKLGLDSYKRVMVSYVDLFHMIESEFKLRFRDLTFANFTNLTIKSTRLRRIYDV